AGSTAIGDTTFLAPNGDLYEGNTLVATGVASVGVPTLSSNDDAFISFMSSTGVASLYRRSDGLTVTFPSVPVGSTAIGDTTYLAPNGNLYVGNALVASNVASAGMPSLSNNNDAFTPYMVAPTCAW
ncbi:MULTISPECIES: hypothetical protein, partial [unclassified Microbacterium]